MVIAGIPLASGWQTAGDVATVLGVVVALLAGIASTIVLIRQEKVTRAGQDLQREHAEAAASRSEAAARLTEEYTRRVVEALESIAHTGAPGSPTRVAPARWSLFKQIGDRYVLENVGESMATNVRVSSHESLDLLGLENLDDEPLVVRPGEALTFVAAPSLATADYTITVTWVDAADGEVKTWRYPLPL